MKKIVPFNNILEFKTDVCEISAISLEHDINILDDVISGTFFISGEYKITDGQLEKDKFNFKLPFDIALGSNYDKSTLVVDIDDFRYEIIDRNKLKVNIDLYIDGEIIEDIKEDNRIELSDDNQTEEVIDNIPYKNETISEDKVKEEDKTKTSEDIELFNMVDIDKKRVDLLDEMLSDNDKENNYMNINNNTNNNELDLFDNLSEEDKYVTYRVYRVDEMDTLDKILEKYNITKEELAKYNDIEDIKTGDKLIIPTNDK